MTAPDGRFCRRRGGFGSALRRFLVPLALAGLPAWACTVRELPEEEKNGHARTLRETGAPGAAEARGDSLAVAGKAVAGEIVQMLNASTASWNAGDLDGFLDDYLNSQALTFSGASGVTRGWEEVRGRYERTYWAPGAQRDSLRFEDLQVASLGSDHALALGRYVLYRPEEDGRVTATGHFSLVLRRVEGAWKIIHDHTSASGPS